MSDRRGNVPLHAPAALLFDMDGTLTRPMLNFDAIKAEMGIGDQPILESLTRMDDHRRAVCESILNRHESHAAANSQLNDGCLSLLEWVAQQRVPRALVTRNSRRSMTTVLTRHGLQFDVSMAREDGPPKPDPHTLHLACRQLGVQCQSAWMIGDGRYDIEAGNAAGMRTVWISHGSARPFTAVPWQTVATLGELHALLAASRTQQASPQRLPMPGV